MQAIVKKLTDFMISLKKYRFKSLKESHKRLHYNDVFILVTKNLNMCEYL